MNQSSKSIYLDYAAATPLDPRVAAAMQPYQAEQFANPSALYGAARQTRQALDAARARCARILGAKAAEVILTAGGTESVNLAIMGVGRRFPGARVVAGAIEHAAVIGCLEALEREGHPTGWVPVTADGLYDPAAVAAAIDDQTVLISLAYANSEIGTIQPLAKIATALEAVKADRQRRDISLPLYFHTDAAQAAGALDLHVNRLGVDLLSLNGSKIYGPKQSGLLYVRASLELEPLVYGGGQERGLRSGSENVAAAVGLATALELAQADRQAENRRLSGLCQDFWRQIEQLIPNVHFNGHPTKRLPGNLNLRLDGVDGATAVLALDHAGVAAATGSACAAAKPEPSPVLLALGLSPQQAASGLRFTLGQSTTAAELTKAAGILAAVAQKLRQFDKHEQFVR